MRFSSAIGLRLSDLYSLFRKLNMTELYAFTDGACSGNPGPGGWGVLMQARIGSTVVKERTLCGGEPDTTNNRMELIAAISALEALQKPSNLVIITDSAYVKNGISEWISNPLFLIKPL